MNRTDIINRVCAELPKPVSYLEIGIFDPARNFDHVVADTKLGIEPKQGRDPDILRMTSDEYFAGLARRRGKRKRFGCIFVDGDHSMPQCLRDAQNALSWLAPGGVLIMHDCLPRSADAVLHEKPNNGGAWNGEVWQAWRWVRAQAWLASCVVNDDHGVGIVRVAAPRADCPVMETNTWQNAKDWANIIAPADWEAKGPGVLA